MALIWYNSEPSSAGLASRNLCQFWLLSKSLVMFVLLWAQLNSLLCTLTDMYNTYFKSQLGLKITAPLAPCTNYNNQGCHDVVIHNIFLNIVTVTYNIYCNISTSRSENDNTPQPLDQWTNSPFIGQQVGNCKSFTLTYYLADLFAMHCYPRPSPSWIRHCIQFTSLLFQVDQPSHS